MAALEVGRSGRGRRTCAKRRSSAADASGAPRPESRVATIRQSFGAATSREPSGSDSGRPPRNDDRSPNALSSFARSISSMISHFFLPAAARTWPCDEARLADAPDGVLRGPLRARGRERRALRAARLHRGLRDGERERGLARAGRPGDHEVLAGGERGDEAGVDGVGQLQACPLRGGADRGQVEEAARLAGAEVASRARRRRPRRRRPRRRRRPPRRRQRRRGLRRSGGATPAAARAAAVSSAAVRDGQAGRGRRSAASSRRCRRRRRRSPRRRPSRAPGRRGHAGGERRCGRGTGSPASGGRRLAGALSGASTTGTGRGGGLVDRRRRQRPLGRASAALRRGGRRPALDVGRRRRQRIARLALGRAASGAPAHGRGRAASRSPLSGSGLQRPLQLGASETALQPAPASGSPEVIASAPGAVPTRAPRPRTGRPRRPRPPARG